MGFNSVAVLFNDFDFKSEHLLGERIQDAVRGWSGRERDRLATWFGCGVVASQAHADYSQIVVVGKNTGCPLSEAKDLDWHAINQMKEALERSGYRVTKRRKPSVPANRVVK